MSIPTPRTPGDDRVDPRRDFVTDTIGTKIWDEARAHSKAQLAHAMDMARRGFGGTILIRLPSRESGRAFPEVAFADEIFSLTGVDLSGATITE